MRARPLILLLLAPVLACGGDAPAEEGEGAAPALVVLDNGALRVELDPVSGYGVRSVRDLERGVELLDAGDVAPTLFRIDLPVDGRLTRPTQADAARATAEVSADGLAVDLEWRRVGGAALHARARVALHPTLPECTFELEVDAPGARFERLRFPFLSGYTGLGAAPEDDVLVAPYLYGVLEQDPMAAVREGVTLPREAPTYPGNLSMQFGALYDGDAGFYLACEDTAGGVKSLHLQLADRRTPTASLSWEHRVPPEGSAAWDPGFPVRLVAFAGDWMDACERYRAWTTAQPWGEVRLDEREDRPAWLREPFAVLDYRNFRMPTGEPGDPLPPDEADAVARAFLADLAWPYLLFAPGWERFGPWAGPEMFPPRDGEDALRRAVDAVHARGDRAMHMFCVSWWMHPHGVETPLYLEEGAPNRLLPADAEEYTRDEEFGLLGKSHLMCPATAAWQARTEATVRECLDRGFDLLQLDLFPMNQPLSCWNPEHGHDLGFWRWWYEGWREICRRAAAAAREAGPDVALSAEEMCELYLPWFPVYLSREERRDRVVPDAEAVATATGNAPLFQFVFHDYAAAIGDFSQTCSLGQPSAAHAIARSFSRAKYPGARVPTSGEEVTPAHAEDLAFLDEAVDVLRELGGELTLEARMVRPPGSDLVSVSPPRPVDWRTSAPAIGAFEARDGRRVLLLANAGDEEARVRLAGVAAPARVVARDVDRARCEPADTDLVVVLAPRACVGLVTSW